MYIQTIDKNLLSDLHRKAVANERKRMNFDLRTSALDQSQRMLNALEPGTHTCSPAYGDGGDDDLYRGIFGGCSICRGFRSG